MTERRLQFVITVSVVFAMLGGAAPPADGAVIDGRKWPPGPVLGSPGEVSFSVMPSGSVMDPDDIGPSTDFGALITQGSNQNELATVQAAFSTWASVTNLTNLGVVSDNGARWDAAPADPRGLRGPFGDIRLAATGLVSPSTLAHAYFPPPHSTSAPGDIHFNNARVWSDDPSDTTADADFDFHTVALHELGHSLGLGHTTVPGSVMNPFYQGANRTLGTDDITGIKEVYGPRSLPPGVPPPTPYEAKQHSYPGFDITDPKHEGFPVSAPLPPASPGATSLHSFPSIFEGNVGGILMVGFSDTEVKVQFNSQIGSVSLYDSEITDLFITGDPSVIGITDPNAVLYEGVLLSPNVIIRQDPNRPSVGQIEFDSASHKISSFFDVFTELSLDGGLTWVGSNGSTHMTAPPYRFIPEASTFVWWSLILASCSLYRLRRRRQSVT